MDSPKGLARVFYSQAVVLKQHDAAQQSTGDTKTIQTVAVAWSLISLEMSEMANIAEILVDLYSGTRMKERQRALWIRHKRGLSCGRIHLSQAPTIAGA